MSEAAEPGAGSDVRPADRGGEALAAGGDGSAGARVRVADGGGRLARSLRVGARRLDERRGVIVMVTARDEAGEAVTGLGEASPLPGYSPDSVAACRGELVADACTRAVQWALARARGVAPAEVVAAVADAVARAGLRAPAARFALETALLDAIGRRRGVSVAALLAAVTGAGPRGERAVNGVVDVSDDHEEGADGGAGPRCLRAVDALLARGVRCVKVKIGRPGRFADELAALVAIRGRLDAHGEAALRLDANGAWSPREAPRRLEALARVSPEYVEEPLAVRDADSWATLAAAAPAVPVAIDESLPALLARDGAGASGPTDGEYAALERAVAPLCARGRLAAVVVKPALLGGLIASAALASRAAAWGVDAVVTHMFDGPIALAACAQLALALPGDRACGLDGHVGLSAWPSPDATPWGGSCVRLPDGSGLGVTVSGVGRAEAGR